MCRKVSFTFNFHFPMKCSAVIYTHTQDMKAVERKIVVHTVSRKFNFISRNLCYFCKHFFTLVCVFYSILDVSLTSQKAINCICCFWLIFFRYWVLLLAQQALSAYVLLGSFCRTEIVSYRHMPIGGGVSVFGSSWLAIYKSFYSLSLYVSNPKFCQFLELVWIAIVCIA